MLGPAALDERARLFAWGHSSSAEEYSNAALDKGAPIFWVYDSLL